MFKVKKSPTFLSSALAKPLRKSIAPFKKFAFTIAPLAIAIALPSFAQSPDTTETPDDQEIPSKTICAYDADSEFADPLGARASLTVETSEGNTEFIYERLPAVVNSDSSEIKAEVDNKRTLTLYETSIDDARQLLIDDSSYYAVLLGLAPDDSFVERGFEIINRTLTCREDSDSTDKGSDDTDEAAETQSPAS